MDRIGSDRFEFSFSRYGFDVDEGKRLWKMFYFACGKGKRKSKKKKIGKGEREKTHSQRLTHFPLHIVIAEAKAIKSR